MKAEEFLERFIEELEIEDTEVTVETIIKDLDEWDSMTAMILIGFISNEFEVTLTADDIQALTTIQSLMDKIGKDKFN